jgi:hypothetical protein
MRKHVVLILAAALLAGLKSVAQTDTKKVTIVKAQWPIKGAKPGENIIGKPQQYIRGESNFDHLFISAPEGDAVVAPEGGMIANVSYTYQESLTYMTMFGAKCESLTPQCEKQLQDNIGAELKKRNRKLKGDIAKYISQTIGIKTSSGETYYIAGLHATKPFKTGDKVAKGDEVGAVGYAYSAFDKPHICISRSINSKAADPMGVFGIPSTFVLTKPHNIDVYKDKHPADSLKKEFKVLRKSLEEIHPGLYDYTSKAHMDNLFDSVASKLNRPMTSKEFIMQLKPIMAAIKDSHTSLSFLNSFAVKSLPSILLGFDGRDIVVLNSSVKYKKGERVIAVNGVSASAIIQNLKKTTVVNDGYNSLPTDRMLMEQLTFNIYKNIGYFGNSLSVKMKDGRTVVVPYVSPNKFPKDPFNRWAPDSVSISTKMVKPDVAYLDFNTFELNQVEEDSVENYVERIQRQGVKNLIVDVRDNRGGSITVGNRIMSYFLDSPRDIFCYRMVKSNTTYPMLKYSDSWGADKDVFPEFKAVEGKAGFYDYGDNDSTSVKRLTPNGKTHYTGNIYILANEYSASMATDFPAVLFGQPNCKIVGRETGSCYYQMNAEKFANIIMPATGLNVRIPMIKLVMRETLNPRIPYGHGVIPDYEVKLTLEELTQPKDVILDRALEIIEKEK